MELRRLNGGDNLNLGWGLLELDQSPILGAWMDDNLPRSSGRGGRVEHPVGNWTARAPARHRVMFERPLPRRAGGTPA